MITILIFLIVLSILIFSHEFGHFYAAKKAGIKVEEFGFGFPPRIFGIKKGETTYSINLIPFGGFVKLYGEDGEYKEDPKSFSSKSLAKRAKVIVAGVLMNLILAIFLLILGNFLGLRIGLLDQQVKDAKDIKIQVAQVNKNSPAQIAGLRVLDQIKKLRFENEFVEPEEISQIQQFTKKYAGKEIEVTVLRNNKEIKINLVPRINPPQGEGQLGISLVKTGIVFYPWYEAIWRGVYDTVLLAANIAFAFAIFFKNLFINNRLIADVSGPIGIAVLSGQAAGLGFSYLIQFVALLSINLAILNIIPFPALDGGRLLFIGIEKLKGSPVPKRIEGLVNSLGFAFLIALVILITIKDLTRYF